ncbi:MAG: FAD-dependent oxidoreductase [Candidatus Altiarchaeota archaeon]|nr:FAD-dependent oxidoreductase [Candidatus Altiarchaeota archaeon]
MVHYGKKVFEMYDLIIIGGGPAGLTAAIYASRYKLKTLVLTKNIGGMAVENPEIENYPGFGKISGGELMVKIGEHAEALGTEIRREQVKSVTKDKETFKIITEYDSEFKSKALIISTGLKRRKLGVKNEDKFKGRGISYCATCDGAFFDSKDVAVIGGGDSAAVATLILSEFAKQVYLIYRRDKFKRMLPAFQEKLGKRRNVKLLFNNRVTELGGDTNLEWAKLSDGTKLKLGGLFVEIGFEPEVPFKTNFELKKDSKGFIDVDKGMKTSEQAVFAAGDITNGSNLFQQIITSASEGAMAANSAYLYLAGGV